MKKINIAIMIGRSGSKGLPGKNTINLFGKQLAEYPLLAAKYSKKISKIYVSTDCPKIKKISKKYEVEIINRPKNLSTDKALGEKVFEHAYFFAKQSLLSQGFKINLVALLFANAPNVTSKLINKGINILNKNSYFDSAVTASVYNMWSPLRARRLSKRGNLEPFVPFETFGNPKTLNCDRDSQGDVYFADMGVSVVRVKCLEKMNDGLLPQKWMGKKIYPIKSEAGFDVDYILQIPGAKYWIKKNN